jgi:cytosine/adenosine deaminase-related metal-dependent hydrolase
VQIQGDRIAAVGPAAELLARRGGSSAGDPPDSVQVPIVDLGDAVLIPGLVNPHTHLELTCYAGMIPPAPFWEWISRLIKLRDARSQVERESRAVEDGAWRSLRAGVTTVGDISRRNLHWRVLKTIPIRKVCFVELLSVADYPPRNLDELRAAVEEVEEDELLTVGVTPHAPYTVPGEQIRGAIELAHHIGRPWCTHWSETREEIAFLGGATAALPVPIWGLLQSRGIEPPRLRPIELLEQCCAASRTNSARPAGSRAEASTQPSARAATFGSQASNSQWLRPGALAHVNYIAGEDAARLAQAGHVVMYCPRAHRFFGHPPHPFRRLQAAGVTVALGTDSIASNESLSILDELRFVRSNRVDAPSPEELLRMATLDAAAALGLSGQVGSITPGKSADLAAWACAPGTQGAYEAVLAAPREALGVWVAGSRVI